jgi:hypothetical protein
LYEAGALPAFVKLLNSGNPNAELKALTALVNLSGNGTTTTTHHIIHPSYAHPPLPTRISHSSSLLLARRAF